MELVSLLDDLLKSLKKQGFPIACLFLDKGFASIAVMDYLTRQAQPALIACPIRGKTGGTRALCHGRRSYRAKHTFVSGDQTFTAQVAVCRSFTTAKRTKRLKRRVVWLLYVLIHLDLAPRQARREYRKRFGIEIVYTQMTKPGLFASLAGRDDVANLDLVVSNDDAVDQQLQQLAFLLKRGRSKACLYPLAKVGHRAGQGCQVRMLIDLMFKLVFLSAQRVEFSLQFNAATFIFGQSNHGPQIGFGPAFQLSRETLPCLAERLPPGLQILRQPVPTMSAH
jgi:hypothetical protein